MVTRGLRTADVDERLSCWPPTEKFHVKFGAALLQKFLLAEGFTNSNHVSFGSVPRVATSKAIA